jgi:hypothetical protein
LLAILNETKNNHHETPTLLLYSLVCLRKSLTAHKRYSPLSNSLLGTDENLRIHCLSNDGWGSSDGTKMTSISNGMTSSITKVASISSSKGGSSIGSMSNWGSSIGGNWDLSNSVNWGGYSLGNSLDGVGSGFMNNRLVDSLVGTDGSSDSLASVGRDSLEDGLGNVVGLDNWGRLMGGNGGGDVGVSGLSHGVGQGRDLGDDLSESMSLSSGVGKVASQPVVLDGSRVMCWGTDEVGGSIANDGASWCYSNGASTAKSNEGGEKQEGVHGGSR